MFCSRGTPLTRTSEDLVNRGGFRGRPHGAEVRHVPIGLLVRIRFIIVMIRWTGLAPWEFNSLSQVALHLPSYKVGADRMAPRSDMYQVDLLLLLYYPQD